MTDAAAAAAAASSSSPAVAQVLVVGSCGVDLTCYTPTLPRPGLTVKGASFARTFGGKGANQAVAAARLATLATTTTTTTNDDDESPSTVADDSVRVAFVGRVGDDTFGDDIRRNFSANHVECARSLRTTRGVSSQVAQLCVATGGGDSVKGENQICIIPGANDCLTPADVDNGDADGDDADRAVAALFSSAHVVALQFEVPSATNRAALRAARRRAPTAATIVNTAPVVDDFDRGDVFALVDFVVPNEHEAAALTGVRIVADDDDAAIDMAAVARAATALCDKGVRFALITLGARGCYVAQRGRAAGDDDVHLVCSPRVDAVDTVGAGDTFVGSFAFFLAVHRASSSSSSSSSSMSADAEFALVRECARRACVCASYAVTRKGAMAAFTRTELLEREGDAFFAPIDVTSASDKADK